jgi:hypothetical protein
LSVGFFKNGQSISEIPDMDFSQDVQNENQEMRIPSMSTVENESSIYEVNARLFKMLAYMSEAERQELQSVLTPDRPQAENRKDLSESIINLSQLKRQNLLEKLENWHNSKVLELREYLRKNTFIPAECASDGLNFTDVIQDISHGGVFIQTNGNFYVDQKISMTFSIPKSEKDITVNGKIVRADSQGIGVKFDELLPDV